MGETPHLSAAIHLCLLLSSAPAPWAGLQGLELQSNIVTCKMRAMRDRLSLSDRTLQGSGAGPTPPPTTHLRLHLGQLVRQAVSNAVMPGGRNRGHGLQCSGNSKRGSPQ